MATSQRMLRHVVLPLALAALSSVAATARAEIELTGQPYAAGLSGFPGSKFTLGNPNSSSFAVYGILSRERSDNPCFVAIATESVNSATSDSAPEKSLCGGNGPTSSTLGAVYFDTSAGGADDHVFVSGVQVCMDRGDERVKGFHLHGKRISSSGALVDFSPDAQDSRANCHQDHWKRWVNCPAGQIATAVDLHFEAGNTPRSLTGIGLQCRSVSVR